MINCISSIIPSIFPKGWEFLGKIDSESTSITLSALYDKKDIRKERVFKKPLGKRGIFNVKECNFVFAFYPIFPFKQIFPKRGPIFPKNVGFSGNLWENGCFPQIAAVSLHQLSARSELLTNEPKRKARSCFFLLWKQKLCEWCSRASPSLYRVRKVRTDR